MDTYNKLVAKYDELMAEVKAEEKVEEIPVENVEEVVEEVVDTVAEEIEEEELVGDDLEAAIESLFGDTAE